MDIAKLLKLNRDIYNNSIEKYFKNNDHLNNFGIVSCLYSHFLPNIRPSRHISTYIESLIYKPLLAESGDAIFKHIAQPKFTEHSKSNLEEMKKSPHIITTYHFGIYLLTCALLFENGIRFSALISNSGFTHNGNRFIDINLSSILKKG